MCFSKRKRTTPTNEAKAYTIRKTYLNQYVPLKRKRTRPLHNASRWQGTPEPCHRLWRCKTEEPRPYGREPWHSVLEKILFAYAFLASGGSREPCHRFQRCKIEEPRPCGREPWHFVLEKILQRKTHEY